MSDTPLVNVRSAGLDMADESIQQKWDQFAKTDFSNDRKSFRAPLAVIGHKTTNRV